MTKTIFNCEVPCRLTFPEFFPEYYILVTSVFTHAKNHCILKLLPNEGPFIFPSTMASLISYV